MRQVRSLLMGGQACVLYGGAEFSRDVDLALLADDENLARLRLALADLRAEPVAVPAFEIDYLHRGHAVHFRCQAADVAGLRLDLMAVMRGVAPFADLWPRRTTIEVAGESIDLLALPDLVQSKKTQRDKDWPMIRRLVEANYFAHRASPTAEQLEFWLRELRSPALLIELVSRHPERARLSATGRKVVGAALAGNLAGVDSALTEEQAAAREADRAYWLPLRRELEDLRRR